jgi:hypothetical protein
VRARRIEVFYFVTDDCFYCQHWEAARKPELLELLRGTGARLVEIRGETLEKPIREPDYPPGHRWLYAKLGELRGVPRFVLAVDGKVLLQVYGTSAYSEIFAPRLRALLAR